MQRSLAGSIAISLGALLSIALAALSSGCILFPGAGARRAAAAEAEQPQPARVVADFKIKNTKYCVLFGTNLSLEAFDAAGQTMELPKQALEVTSDPEGLVNEHHTHVDSPLVKSLERLGTEVTITATLKLEGGAAPLVRTAKLGPAYCSDDEVSYMGSFGQNGSDGADGSESAPGAPGAAGGPGGPAEDLKIEADWIKGPEGEKLILAVIADATGKLHRFAVWDPASGPLKISARGGQGGMGGRGGHANASCANGGDGARGGAGAAGANVSLVIGEASLEKAIAVNVSGGSGGSGGGGGQGPMGAGCNGSSGRTGDYGQAGRDGKLRVSVKKKPPMVQEARATCTRCRK